MPKNKFKSGSDAKAAQTLEFAAPADVDASADRSLEETTSADHHPSHEQDFQDHASASTASSRSSLVDQSEEVAEANSISADEAAAAAFGPKDLGDIGTDNAEAAIEDDVAIRIAVDWGNEFDSSFCGLKNAGNTCFLNSVGMLLVHCPGVFWYCMFDLEQKENSDDHYFYSR